MYTWDQISWGAPALAIPIVAFITIIVVADTMLFSRNHFPVKGRTVVITGGSQGMGLGLAKTLAAKGANVVIVARTTSKLTTALEEIRTLAQSPSQRFLSISADVTSSQENERIIAEVTAWNGVPPDIVWANAGLAIPRLFLEASEQELRSQMDLNYWGAVWLARATLKAWINVPSSAKEGSPVEARHLITTSTVASFIGLAGYSPYSPPKAALRNLHDTLTSEVELYNAPRAPNVPEIKISCVFPGTILSPGHEIENSTKHAVLKKLEEGDPAQTGDEVARISVRELEKGRRMVTTQYLASAMRAGGLSGSLRDQLFIDTVFGWIAYIIYLFVLPDMRGTVRKWARENGAPVHGKEA